MCLKAIFSGASTHPLFPSFVANNGSEHLFHFLNCRDHAALLQVSKGVNERTKRILRNLSHWVFFQWVSPDSWLVRNYQVTHLLTIGMNPLKDLRSISHLFEALFCTRYLDHYMQLSDIFSLNEKDWAFFTSNAMQFDDHCQPIYPILGKTKEEVQMCLKTGRPDCWHIPESIVWGRPWMLRFLLPTLIASPHSPCSEAQLRWKLFTNALQAGDTFPLQEKPLEGGRLWISENQARLAQMGPWTIVPIAQMQLNGDPQALPLVWIPFPLEVASFFHLFNSYTQTLILYSIAHGDEEILLRVLLPVLTPLLRARLLDWLFNETATRSLMVFLAYATPQEAVKILKFCANAVKNFHDVHFLRRFFCILKRFFEVSEMIHPPPIFRISLTDLVEIVNDPLLLKKMKTAFSLPLKIHLSAMPVERFQKQDLLNWGELVCALIRAGLWQNPPASLMERFRENRIDRIQEYRERPALAKFLVSTLSQQEIESLISLTCLERDIDLLVFLAGGHRFSRRTLLRFLSLCFPAASSDASLGRCLEGGLHISENEESVYKALPKGPRGRCAHWIFCSIAEMDVQIMESRQLFR